MIRLGRMTNKITIQSPPTGSDEYGQALKEWIDFKTVYATKEMAKGRDFFAGNQHQTEIPTVFRTHYIVGVDEKMRIKHNGNLYDVTNIVDPDDRRMELIWHCQKVKE